MLVARHLDAVLVVQVSLELLGIARRKLDRDHLAELPRRARKAAPRHEPLDEGVAPVPHRVPPPLPLELDRCRNGEERGRVARPLPAVTLDELRLGPAPTDDERVETLLQLRPGPEEPRTLRRTEPLVCVAGIGISTDRRQVDRNMSGRVCAVHDREQAQVARPGAELGDRQDRAGRRGDMSDREHAGRPRDVIPERCERRPHDSRPGRVPGVVDGAVLQVGRQHLVLRAEAERAGDHVHPGGRVRDEHEVVRARPEVVAQRPARLLEQPLQSAREELDRPALQLELPALVLLEHRLRARAEGAVVEEDDVRVEQKLVSQAHSAYCRSARGRIGVPCSRPTSPSVRMPSLPRIKRTRTRAGTEIVAPPEPRLAELTAGDLTWVHLTSPDAVEAGELAERFGWHALDLEDVLSKRQRPKVDEYPEYLFVVLHFPAYDKAIQRLNAAELDVF